MSVLKATSNSGSGGTSIGKSTWIALPASTYTTDTSGNLFPYVYAGSGGNASAYDAGWGVVASLGADVVLQMRFQLPPNIPAGTLKLVSYALANYTGSNEAQYTVSDAVVGSGASPSAATLTGDTQVTLNSWTADQYIISKTTLSGVPTADGVSVVAVTFNHTNWTLAQILMTRWMEVIE
jgi:hypothetical protein